MRIGRVTNLIDRRKDHKYSKQNSNNPINDVILFHIAIFFGRVLKRKSKNFFVTGICSLFIIVVSLTCTVTILFNYGPTFKLPVHILHTKLGSFFISVGFKIQDPDKHDFGDSNSKN
jgi:hypothetical protein